MDTHVKPTQEELDEQIRKSQEEIDRLDQEEKKVVEDIIKAEEAPEEKQEEKIIEEEKTEVEEEIKTEEKKEIVENKEDPDYKKKFIASTTESQILFAKENKLNEAYDKANSLAEPTDEEMKVDYPEWDDMTALEKKMAKKTTLTEKKFAIINEVNVEFRDIQAWQKSVEEMIADPKTSIAFPDFEGKEDDFRIFAMKPSRKGTPKEELVAAFLYNIKVTRTPNKGKMFETSSGDNKPKPNNGKISLEQARILQKTDYNKYKEYLMAGKIDTSTI